MNITSDINILGGLSDFNLINVFLNENLKSLNQKGKHHSFTIIKTDKSVKRFEKAITNTLLNFLNKNIGILVRRVLTEESITADSLLLLFWNASANNELLNYLNEKVYFPAFYTGRITIKQDEVAACLKELKQTETSIQNWSESTVEVTASKYLTLLKKFNLMKGSANKTITHPYLSDKMLIVFIYWLLAIGTKSNLLDSQWLKYCFSEKKIFIERIMQKKLTKFINLNYSGNILKVEAVVSYEKLYDAISQS